MQFWSLGYFNSEFKSKSEFSAALRTAQEECIIKNIVKLSSAIQCENENRYTKMKLIFR